MQYTVEFRGRMSTLLVERAMAGDAEAFSVLVRERFDALHGLSRLIAGDANHGEDALQDALIRAWRDLRGLRDASKFDAWLRKLVVNACRDQSRRQRRRSFGSMSRVAEPVIHDQDLSLVEQRDQLDRAMSRLAPEERAVLAVRFYLDLPGTEAAAALGLRDATYRTRLRRAIQALAAAVAAEERHERRVPEPDATGGVT
jgi:RNA polymerase sigma factor (sigma-70 family)